jgi:phosphopantetheinyl transferase
MPLLQTLEHNDTHIAIWKITESEDFFSQALGFGSEQKHPKRRLEHLSGRFLLQLLVPGFPFERISIHPLGKPMLEDNSIWFSISHSFPYAAAIVSTQKSVGIDIQVYQEKILRLQSKFLSNAEQEITTEDMHRITLAWCAKEALFKYYGLGAVDFKADMPITSMDLHSEDKFRIRMSLQKTREECILNGQLHPEFALSYM